MTIEEAVQQIRDAHEVHYASILRAFRASVLEEAAGVCEAYPKRQLEYTHMETPEWATCENLAGSIRALKETKDGNVR
jgi:hypothetical protein